MRRRVPDWVVNSTISSQRVPGVIGWVGVAVLCGVVQLAGADSSARSVLLVDILLTGARSPRTLHPSTGEYKPIQHPHPTDNPETPPVAITRDRRLAEESPVGILPAVSMRWHSLPVSETNRIGRRLPVVLVNSMICSH